MANKIIAIVGAGVMGCDLALDLASFGYSVVLKDLDAEALDHAEVTMRKNFKFFKLMHPRFSQLSLDELLSHISLTDDYRDFHSADWIIENITEDFECKRRLYLELREHCAEEVYYGVNTSCISITKLAALMPKPENVIGMHLMNPVPMKPLVEVIRGFYTSDETVNMAQEFLGGMEKYCVVVNDSPGFVTNRVLMLTINESVWVVQDQVAEAADVDTIFKLGFSHKMGPLATADLIGLDTILRSLKVLHDSYNDPKYRPCPLLVKMVDAGLLGKKSGQGFFKY